MTRHIEIIQSLDGIIYDVEMYWDRGDSCQVLLAFMLARVKSLRKSLDQEQRYYIHKLEAERANVGKTKKTQ